MVIADIVTTAHNNSIHVAFQNCVSFNKCITRIDGTAIDDSEDLDLTIPMYNLIEYNSSYSQTTGSWWFYSKDEATYFNEKIANNSFKSFEYMAKLLENTEADNANGILQNATIAVP